MSESTQYVANQVDELTEKDAATIAANVCAAVLSSGKHDGRFAMSIDELRRAMDLSKREAKVATMWAAKRDWVRLRVNQVELKAAAHHVQPQGSDREAHGRPRAPSLARTRQDL